MATAILTTAFTPEPVTNEPMYCLFAPDGNWQPMTLSPDFATCVAVMNLLAQHNVGTPFARLIKQGYKILPVSVTAVVTGDENTAFQKQA